MTRDKYARDSGTPVAWMMFISATPYGDVRQCDNPHGAEAERRVDLLLKWGRPVLGAPHEDLGPFTRRRSCRWVSLTSYSAVGNSRKNTAISLSDTNKDTRPK